MTGLQLAIVAGALFGLGLATLLWQLVPAQPDLNSALARLAPERATTTGTAGLVGPGPTDRAGLWVHRHLPLLAAGRLPRKELAVLRIPLHRYLGEKVLYAAIGLLLPALFVLMLGLAGFSLPFAVPVLLGLLLAPAMSFIPDAEVHAKAKVARQEFSRALSAFIDLVALERINSSGSTQALEAAAAIGDSWVFRRLREELARARWSGTAPWDGLSQLAEELGVPDLGDLGDIMRLAGEQEATVYNTLRARAASLRVALLNDEHTKANAASARSVIPLAALGLIFFVLLIAPGILRLAG